MEFFQEKNGVYHADPISGSGGKGTILRILVSLIPLGVIAYLLYSSPMGKQGSENRIPLIIGAGMFLFTNLLMFVLKKAGFRSGISVNQMDGTLAFRKPGGNKISVQITSLNKIVIDTVPMKASVLCLSKAAGGRHVVMFSKDTMQLRQLADELSTLTSLSVSEEVRETKYSPQ